MTSYVWFIPLGAEPLATDGTCLIYATPDGIGTNNTPTEIHSLTIRYDDT